jgi:hypothetical protein
MRVGVSELLGTHDVRVGVDPQHRQVVAVALAEISDGRQIDVTVPPSVTIASGVCRSMAERAAASCSSNASRETMPPSTGRSFSPARGTGTVSSGPCGSGAIAASTRPPIQ